MELTENRDIYQKYYVAKTKNQSFAWRIIIITICAIFIITMFALIFSLKNDYYKKRSYYLLSLGSFSTLEAANLKAGELKERGAGGKVVRLGSKFCVIAMIYQSRADASEVEERLRGEVDATIIELSAPSLSAFKRCATQSERAGFEVACSLAGELMELLISGDQPGAYIRLGQLANDILAAQNQLAADLGGEGGLAHGLDAGLDNTGEAAEAILDCLKNDDKAVKQCMSALYKGASAQNSLALLMIEVCLNEQQMRESLAKIA